MANDSSQPLSKLDTSFGTELSDAEKSIGDISGLEAEDAEHSIGNLDNIENNNEADELLGDISLLDEAIAELEADADDSGSLPEDIDQPEAEASALAEMEQEENSGVAASDSAEIAEPQDLALEPKAEASELNMDISMGDDSDVPVLTEEISEPVPQTQASELDIGEGSVPLLDEVATDFEPPALDSSMAGGSSVTQFSASEANPEDFADLELDDINIDSAPQNFDQASEAAPSLDSIDSLSSLDSSSDIPLEVPIENSGFAEDLLPDSAPSRLSDSDANPDFANTSPARATEHRVQVGEGQGLSISIPYELHAQLSKKIDSLVIEATTSLTNELHNQLSARLESLLGQAVEAVLPNLIDQMANGLRNEVKDRVRQQLPSIINDVLGKTSIND